MAIIFMDGFDYYNSATYGARVWTSFNSNTFTSPGRFSDRCCGISGATLYMDVPSAQTYIVAFALFVPVFGSTGALLSFMESSTVHTDLRVDATGRLQITRDGTVLATATDPLNAATWYHVQVKVKIDNTTGTYEVRVEGSVGTQGIAAATGQDTQNGGTATCDRIRFTGNTPCFIDDVVILDTSGSANNDFPGDCKISLSMPTGAGNYAQFTPSAGANWQNVDDNPPDDDTTYNESNTVGHKDSFDRAAVTITGTVLGIKHTIVHRKTDAGSREIASLVRSGGADYTGDTKSCTATYKADSQIYEQDPDTSAPWIEAGINGAEFGIEVIS